MKSLIIGGGGFVGKYLAEHLMQDRGWETVVTKLPKETVSVDGCEIYNLDILDQDAVEALVALGYGSTESLKAVRSVNPDEHMDVETVLKDALKHLF